MTALNFLQQRLIRLINSPSFLPIISGVLVLWFFIWLYLTFVPIMVVEAKYLSFKVASSLGVTDLRALFVPNFESLNLQATSKHRDYGITIPSLNLDEPVVFNVDPNDTQAYSAALRLGIAHASGTAFPDNPGLGYYFAHSSNPDLRRQFNAVFYLLGKMNPGDDVYIWHEDQRHDYVVTHTQVTDPDDVAFLYQEYDQETIVMQTCWPPGTTSQRLLVFAERR